MQTMTRIHILHTIGFLLWVTVSMSSAIAQPFGLDQRTVVNGLTFPLDQPDLSGGNVDVEINQVFSQITVENPLLITAAHDGSNRLFVVEKDGLIKVFPNSNTTTSAEIFLDISGQIATAGEQGLLGMAFDPNFTQNRYFYVYYSVENGGRRSVVSRFQVSSSNPNQAIRNSEDIIIEVAQIEHREYHKGGMIAFGPDGMLYIALGDSVEEENSQDCANMLGAILRIDPNGGTPYTVPNDNPYAGSASHSCGTRQNVSSQACGQQGENEGLICSEIWATGFRNPWRFSFDRIDGTLWLGDVGEADREEIDIVRAGQNYGWPYFEGTLKHLDPPSFLVGQLTIPIFEYDHNFGRDIAGGVVYRGSAIPSLYGKYIYADIETAKILALEYDGESVLSNTLIPGSTSRPVAFGEDEAGEVYIVSFGRDAIYKLEPKGGSLAEFPRRLSDTGLFSNLQLLEPTPGIIEFDVNAPLWSDNAVKMRWIALPGTQDITFNSTDAYSFPTGTALIKHFELPISSNQNRRLETRVMFRHNQGWAGYTYKWNSSGTDADLLLASLEETYSVEDSSSPVGTRAQTWYYPSSADCLSCHTSESGRVLGVRTRQLNRNFDYPTTSDNQLRTWNHIGLFSQDIGNHQNYDIYPQYHDGSKSLESRSRAYMAANCSHCHRPGIPRADAIDLRYGTALPDTHLIDQPPSFGDLGISGARRITSGNKTLSILWERLRRFDGNRMPPLGTNLADRQTIDLLGQWIDSLGSDNTAPRPPMNLRSTPLP